MSCLGVFSIGTAASKTAASIFVTRFSAGVLESTPVSNVAATLGDIWAPQARGNAVVLYSIAAVGGPTIGPLIGAALVTNSQLGWRWTEYVEAIWVLTIFAVCLFALPESYHPVLLGPRAAKLRADTGGDYYHSARKGDIRYQNCYHQGLHKTTCRYYQQNPWWAALHAMRHLSTAYFI